MKKATWQLIKLCSHCIIYTTGKDFENEYLQICLDNNLGVINYYSLASGFLTGKYRSENDLGKSARGGGNRKYLNKKGLHILAALDTVAAKYNSTVSSVAIAWLIAQPAIVAPIASATSLPQLDSLIKAASLQLSADDIKLLTKASDIKEYDA